MSHASQLARSVLAKSWSGNVPVDIVAMLKANNIELRKLALPEGVRGRMNPQPGGAVIYYNPDNKLIVNRFMGAHLLGKYLMGHTPGGDITAANFGSKSTDPHDVYANDFAMELLIPSDALFYFAGTKHANTVEKAANFFCVSSLAMGHAMDKTLTKMYSAPAQNAKQKPFGLAEDLLGVAGLAASLWIGM